MTLSGRSILLVDDHAVVRAGLCTVLQAIGATVVGEAGSTREALSIEKSLAPDVVVTDLSMPGPNGLHLTRTLRSRRPRLPILMLSSFSESLFAEQAIAAGASGYLMKEAPVSQFRTAVEVVSSGAIYLSESMWEALYVAPTATDLTTVERAILSALADDNPGVSAIAADLALSRSAVTGHIASLISKMRLPSEVSLRLAAARTRPGAPAASL